MPKIPRLLAAPAGALGLGLILYCSGHPARADERADTLRLQYTEFCAVVKPPPQALIDAVEGSFGLEPKKWASSMMWLAKLAEEYNKRKCGDV